MQNILNQDNEYVFKKAGDLLSQLKNKRLFITGGTGFIGKHLLEFFHWLNVNHDTNIELLVLTRNPESFLSAYPYFSCTLIHFIKDDLLDISFPEHFCPDYIIHAAADSDAKLNREQPLKMIDTIINGTKRILDYGTQCVNSKILFLSSGAVYGKADDLTTGFLEDYSGAPDCLHAESAYGESKRMAELYCKLYTTIFNLNVTIARCFAFCGPYLPLDKHFAVGNFIYNCLKRHDIIIKGDGIPRRSYMYTSDLIIWLLFCLVKGKSGEAYNVGSDCPVTIRDLASKVASFFPGRCVTVLNEVNPTDRNFDYFPCTDKIKNELNVPEIIPLAETINRTIRYHLDEQDF